MISLILGLYFSWRSLWRPAPCWSKETKVYWKEVWFQVNSLWTKQLKTKKINIFAQFFRHNRYWSTFRTRGMSTFNHGDPIVNGHRVRTRRFRCHQRRWCVLDMFADHTDRIVRHVFRLVNIVINISIDFATNFKKKTFD